jgi:hypothetical protein
MILTVLQTHEGYKLHVELKPKTRQLVPAILSGGGLTPLKTSVVEMFPEQALMSPLVTEDLVFANENGSVHSRPTLLDKAYLEASQHIVLDILWLAKDGPMTSVPTTSDKIRNILGLLSSGTQSLHERFKKNLILYDIKIKEKLR